MQNPSHQSTTFALLAFVSNNAIRLSNFSSSLVLALKSLFSTTIGLRSFRDNAEHKLVEMILNGKPWCNPKNINTESILVRIFNVMFTHGYNFVSHLEYGRENNDRLLLAFARHGAIVDEDQTLSQPLLECFVLSFHSPTILRVVCPPPQVAPVILQCVRDAWPRRVNSERKLGEGCYEFELKGHSWFREDTFAQDAPTHTLTILRELGRHGCKLLTSLRLTASRSGNKDFWLFSSPGSITSPAMALGIELKTESTVHLGSPLQPSTHEPILDHPKDEIGDDRDTNTVVIDGPKTPCDAEQNYVSNRLPDAEPVSIPPAASLSPPCLASPSLLPAGEIGAPSDKDGLQVSEHESKLPETSHDIQHTPSRPPAKSLTLPENTEGPYEQELPTHKCADADTGPSDIPMRTLRIIMQNLPVIPSRHPAETHGNEPITGTEQNFNTLASVGQLTSAALLRVDVRSEADGSSITTGPLPPGAWSDTSLEADDSVAQEVVDTTNAVGAEMTAEVEDAAALCTPKIKPRMLSPGDSDVATEGTRRVIEAAVKDEDKQACHGSQEKQKEDWVLVGAAPNGPAAAAQTLDDLVEQAPTTQSPLTGAVVTEASEAGSTSQSASHIEDTKRPSSLRRFLLRSSRKDSGMKESDSERNSLRPKGGIFLKLRGGK